MTVLRFSRSLDRPVPSSKQPRSSKFLQNVVHFAEGASERQGDEDSDAVGEACCKMGSLLKMDSGLDNAGKTTIVKKIMNEDVNSVSPTLGFIIKTIDYDG